MARGGVMQHEGRSRTKDHTSELVRSAPWAVLGTGPGSKQVQRLRRARAAAGGGACESEEGGSGAAAVAGLSPPSADATRVHILIPSPVPT